jgi:organic radical activating enzyme
MLNISEHFYSIQGEGFTVGQPAYFIRLQGCNLMCGGPNASLVKEGKATWWCDSEVIWKSGSKVPYDDLIDAWKEQDILERILEGNINLIWTGGEPTMPRHVNAITEFMAHLTEKYPEQKVFNEIETNGTIVVPDAFYLKPKGSPIKWMKGYPFCFNIIPLDSSGVIQQINCSPKLANSGMSESMRINPEAIKQINKHPSGYFKFVISSEDDIKEIQETYLQPFNIDHKRVIIMPGVDNREDLPERTAFLFEMTKKYGYRGITRQHILAWDRVVGV